MVDMVVHRHDLRPTLARLCRLLTKAPAARPPRSPQPSRRRSPDRIGGECGAGRTPACGPHGKTGSSARRADRAAVGAASEADRSAWSGCSGCCERLDHPERELPPVIHVAGTNGKGSTCAYLRAILEAAGLRVHVILAASRALQRAHPVGSGRRAHRRRGAGRAAGSARAGHAGDADHLFRDRRRRRPSACSRRPGRLLLLEVGLGGRLDATNVVERPAGDRDHAGIGSTTPSFSGDDAADIAGEKAGIIKRGAPGIVRRSQARRRWP